MRDSTSAHADAGAGGSCPIVLSLKCPRSAAEGSDELSWKTADHADLIKGEYWLLLRKQANVINQKRISL